MIPFLEISIICPSKIFPFLGAFRGLDARRSPIDWADPLEVDFCADM
jgi:hypothetical protein